MTSLIIIDEVSKIKARNENEKIKEKVYNLLNSDINTKNEDLKNNLNESINENFYIHFQNLNFDEIDFEMYIERTEKEMKKLKKR